MQTGGRGFPESIEPVDVALSVDINFNTATGIMRTGNHRYQIPGNINASVKTMCVYIWEMVLKTVFIQMCAIEPYMVISPNFHLVIYSPGNNISWCERSPAVVPVHELFT